jgi:hypothetical protein
MTTEEKLDMYMGVHDEIFGLWPVSSDDVMDDKTLISLIYHYNKGLQELSEYLQEKMDELETIQE